MGQKRANAPLRPVPRRASANIRPARPPAIARRTSSPGPVWRARRPRQHGRANRPGRRLINCSRRAPQRLLQRPSAATCAPRRLGRAHSAAAAADATLHPAAAGLHIKAQGDAQGTDAALLPRSARVARSAEGEGLRVVPVIVAGGNKHPRVSRACSGGNAARAAPHLLARARAIDRAIAGRACWPPRARRSVRGPARDDDTAGGAAAGDV
ncbi:hypothetical protein PsYK624_013740 [Phanerochaete sordida]|uniref:Uncharacterized protein n=1 Tax=Phanerochaete sordida TaxID=48140 RepID=A0A9P3FZQ2_9APHY|nr:hypothetical protein PsYK624_013740 [Phanerochaete sordida]